MTTTEPSRTGPQVQPAGHADLQALVATLANAFADDPIINWAVRADDRRPAAIHRVFALEVAAALPHGEVYRTGDVHGVAVWYPPGDGWQVDEAVLARLAKEIPEISGAQRQHRPFALFEALDVAHPRRRHRYLHWLGVAPARQRRGTGSALLRSMLARCDADGLPAYLEATSPDNVRLYQRHGFVVTEQLQVPGGCPPMWLMWREPAAGRS